MNVRDGTEGLPDLREFLDKLPRKPCPAKLPPEYCKICRRLNREVADYCETRKLPDRMALKPEEEPEAPEPEEYIRPAGIERAAKVEEPPQPFQRKSPLLERPDFHEGETSLEFVSSQRVKEEAKKSLPKFIPVKKKPRAFIPIEEPLPPPPDDFMAFDVDDGKPSIFRSPDSLGETEDMFTLVSGHEALEVEPMIVEAEVMEATETVFASSEGVVETVDISGGAADVEFEPPAFEFLAEEEPVFAEAVEVVEEPSILPEPESLMDSIEEAEKGIQELVDEIAGTQEGSAEDEFALDQAMFMPTPETPAGGAAPPKKKKKKKIKKGTGKKPLKKKKKIKKVISPVPAVPGPEDLVPVEPPPEDLVPVEPPPGGLTEEEPMAVGFQPEEPMAAEPVVKKKKKMKLKRAKKALRAEAPPEEHIPEALPAETPYEEPMEEESMVEETPSIESIAQEPIKKKKKKMRWKKAKRPLSAEPTSVEPPEEESLDAEFPSQEPVATEPVVKKKKKMKLKKVKRTVPAEAPPEEHVPETLPAEIPPEEPPKKKKKIMRLWKAKKGIPAEAHPEEHIPEALPAETPTEETIEEEPVTEEFPFGEPPEEESMPEDFPSEEASSEGPAYEETVTEEPTYEEPVTEETTSEKSDIEIAEHLESMIRAEEPEEPVVEEEKLEEPEPDMPAIEEEEAAEPPAEEEHVEEPAEEEGIDMEAFEPPSEAGFFFTPGEDMEDESLGQLGMEEEDEPDFASKMKKLKRQTPGFEITAPDESKEELPEEESQSEPEAEEPEPRKPAKKLKLKKRKKMKLKKLKMKPRKKVDDEEASGGGEDTE